MPSALVAGGSRGVGKGIATALFEAGYSVFATGRSIESASLPSAVVRIPCDHTDDRQTTAVFEQIAARTPSVDIVANVTWGGYERMLDNGQFTWPAPFWEQPAHRWSSMFDAGVRAAWTVSSHAVRLMLPHQSGLIVNVSFWPAQKYVGNAIYGASKAATDKLTADMAHELRPHHINVVSLYPGLVRTEAVLAAAAQGWIDLTNSESPEFIGRVIAALARDPNACERSGHVLVAAAVAREFGVTDIDGRQPVPLTLETV